MDWADLVLVIMLIKEFYLYSWWTILLRNLCTWNHGYIKQNMNEMSEGATMVLVKDQVFWTLHHVER
jgi:hypothetical protein